jgi:hypothetical protein
MATRSFTHKSTLLLITIVLAVCIMSCSAPKSKPKPSPTPVGEMNVTLGSHIVKIQTGTGFDQQKGTVQGATSTFHNGETVYLAFTVKNQEKNVQIVLKLFQNKELEDTSSVVTPASGTHTYLKTISLNNSGVTGTNVVEIDYNGIVEASIAFIVT